MELYRHSETGEEFSQLEIDDLARAYAAGRIVEWMIQDAVDDDAKLMQIVIKRSRDFGSVDDGEAIDGLI